MPAAFVLERRLGAGAQATVFRARHAATGAVVAVKALTASDDARLAAFRTELRTVAGLDHPRIVRILGIARGPDDVPEGLPPGTPWFAMELASGTLRDRIEAWEALRPVVVDVLDALSHAHARGVLHLDLKACNVLVGCTRSEDDIESGVLSGLRLSDFGVARAFGDGDVKARIVGTPTAMAPEQVRGETRSFGPWTDLYGLGHLVWALCTGTDAYRGSTREVLQAQLRGRLPPFAPRFAVPPDLGDWLAWCLDPDPARRPHRAADARAAFDGLRDLVAVPTPARAAAREDPSLTLDLEALDLPSEEAPASEPRPTRRWWRPPFPDEWRRHEPWGWLRALPDAGIGVLPLAVPRLVGREAEMDRLWSALGEVHAGGPARAVVLQGPRGVGKTRLAEAFAERAHEAGVATILRVAHHREPAQADGLVTAIARWAGLAGLTGKALEARAADLLRSIGAPEPWRPDVLLDCVAHQRLPPPTLVADALGAATLRRPLVVLVDDAGHGPETLAVVEALLARVAPRPTRVLAVLVAEDPPLAGRDDVEVLRIGRLADDAMDQLLGTWLGFDPRVAGRIAERARGHAGTALALAGALATSGRLRVTARGLSLPGDAEPTLPADLDEALRARLPALGDPERAVLERLVVVGGTVQHPPEGLREAELLVPTPDGWEAPPAVVEVVSAAMQEDGRLADAHLRAAAEPGLPPASVGRHLLAAGRIDEAVLPLLEGARAARLRGQLRDGERCLDRAEDALRRCSTVADPRWERLHAEALEVAVARGSVGEIERRVEVALADGSAHGWGALVAGALETRGYLHHMRLRRREAVVDVEEAVRRWEALGRTEEALRAMVNMATYRTNTGDLEGAAAVAREAARRATGHPRVAAGARVSLAILHLTAGDPASAEEELLVALELARTGTDEALLARVERELAVVYLRLGRLDDAERRLEAAEDPARRGGSWLAVARVMALRGQVLRARGDLPAALATTLTSLALQERLAAYSESTRLQAAVLQLLLGDRAAASEGALRYLERGARGGVNEAIARAIRLAVCADAGDRAAAEAQWALLEPLLARVDRSEVDLSSVCTAAAAACHPELSARVHAALVG